jgi:hypothetical protein
MSLKLKRNFDAFHQEDMMIQCPQPNLSFLQSYTQNVQNVQPKDRDVMQLDEDTPIKKKKINLIEGLRGKRPNHFVTSEQINIQNNQVVFDNDFTREIGTPKRRQQRLFTEDEVKKIVLQREEHISDYYNKLLQDLLQEQFNSFVNFNQDCISKQFNDRDFSYTS